MITKKHLLKSLALLISVSFLSTTAQAQWSASFNLGYLFDGYIESPQMLFKKGLNDGKAAFRFSLGGDQYSNQNPQLFFKDSKYENLDDWPSDVDEANQNSNKSSSLVIAPGFELRTAVGEKNLVYYGIDLMLMMSSYEYSNSNYYTNYDQNTEMYTIYQIYHNAQTSNQTHIMPKLFLGVGRDIGHGFSILAETSIGADINTQTSEYTNANYAWNYTDEEFVDNNNLNDDEYVTPEAPWNVNYNWLPRFDFWFTYTFGSNE